VRGPLNIARPVQGWPVIVQAGASEAGRQLAAETAEMVFATGGTISLTAALLCRREGPHGKCRPRSRPSQDPARRLRRGRRHVDEAKAKRKRLDSLVHYDSGDRLAVDRARPPMPRASIPTARCPRFPPTNASKSGRERVIELARRENLTVRQLARAPRRLRRASKFVGTARDHRRPDGGMAADERLRRLQRDVPLSAGAGSTTSSTGWCRNCSAAACSGATMKAGPCARIWACRGRDNRFFETNKSEHAASMTANMALALPIT
jgi:hypothetical protein